MIPAALPSTDCEAIDPVGLAQDVNAWTSFAYLGVGVLLAGAALRRRLTRAALLLGALVAAEAIGSFLFHGRPGTASKWLHDVALVGMLATMAGWHVGRLVRRGDAGAWAGGLAVTAVAGALHPAVPDAVNAAVVVLPVVLSTAEVAARRRGEPAAFGWGFVALVGVSIAVYLLGRTDGPLCDPDSAVQLHGAWHVLTALAVFVWADRALAVEGPAVGSGVGRGIVDLLVGSIAVVLVRAFHRSVDVTDRHHLPVDRPVVLVVNHGNGFVDPVVLAAAMRSMPRFIAKAALWRIVPARLALDALAVLPVYRSSDGDDPHGNDRTFHATNRALARGDAVAIFPEGTTGDRAGLDRVRSGAARIALGGRAAGVAGIAVVPVGMAFESRVQTRSRAAVAFGAPLDLDTWCAQHASARDDRTGDDRTGDDRAGTGELTEEIRGRLTAVSPVYATVDEREQLRMAAAVTLHAEDPDGRPPRFGEVERRGSELAQTPEDDRRRVIDALAHHVLRREMVGLGDADLAPGPLRRSGRNLVLAALAVAIVGPILLTAALVHLPAVLLVNAAVASVGSTATKGTVRLLVGLVSGLLTWWVVGVVVADGAGRVVLVMLATAALGALALATWSSVFDALHVLRRWFRARDRRSLIPGLVATRDELVAAVDAARHNGPARF